MIKFIKSLLVPKLYVIGMPISKESTTKEFIDFIQRITANDFTAQSQFLGDFDRFANKKIQNGRINMIPGIDVGIQTIDDRQIKIEDLMSNN